MAHHLTPSELAEEMQIPQEEVIGKCVELGVPIFHGRIDKNLFESTLRSGEAPPQTGQASAG